MISLHYSYETMVLTSVAVGYQRHRRRSYVQSNPLAGADVGIGKELDVELLTPR